MSACVIGGAIAGVGVGVTLRAGGSGGGSARGAMDVGKSRARREETTKIRFDNVAGCVEEKEEMKELVEYLKNPQKFAKMG